MLTVPSTIAAPAAFTVVFYSPALGFDLTTVTGVTFNMLRRDGTTLALTGKIVSQTQSQAVVQYAFVGGEITTTGAYLLAPQLIVSGGFIPASTITMMVTSQWGGSAQLETSCWLTASALIPQTPYVPTWVQTPTYGPELVSAASPYTIPQGNTSNAVNLTSGPVTVKLSNGGADGETKKFKASSLTVPLSTNDFIITAAAGNLYPSTGDGAGTSMVDFTGAFDVTLTWIAASNNGAGGWYL